MVDTNSWKLGAGGASCDGGACGGGGGGAGVAGGWGPGGAGAGADASVDSGVLITSKISAN